jgi:hypothetical protein
VIANAVDVLLVVEDVLLVVDLEEVELVVGVVEMLHVAVAVTK